MLCNDDDAGESDDDDDADEAAGDDDADDDDDAGESGVVEKQSDMDMYRVGGIKKLEFLETREEENEEFSCFFFYMWNFFNYIKKKRIKMWIYLVEMGSRR